jgi:secreted trypsin-like serine protease
MRADKRKIAALFCALGALTLCGGALGVVGGTADTTGHPYVVAAFAPHELCSGALVSAKVVVTAAHCYHGYDEGASVQVTLGQVVHPDDVFLPTTTTYSGAIHRLKGRDIAVVVLGGDGVPLGRYAQLPALGLADTLPSNQRVDVVGFGWSAIKNGLQFAFGTKQMTTSNLASAGSLSSQFVKVISGPCHGDSGAPNLVSGEDTVLAITTYSNGNPNCNGDTYAERLDTTDALGFIRPYVEQFLQ